MRIKSGEGELVGDIVVHRDEHLPRLDGRGDERGAVTRPAANKPQPGVGMKPESRGVAGMDFDIGPAGYNVRNTADLPCAY